VAFSGLSLVFLLVPEVSRSQALVLDVTLPRSNLPLLPGLDGFLSPQLVTCQPTANRA